MTRRFASIDTGFLPTQAIFGTFRPSASLVRNISTRRIFFEPKQTKPHPLQLQSL